jgi:site-specific DNA-methyltransferase (adenine-specific)
MVSFYGWNRVDRFMAAWKAAGFYAVGQIVFTKTYASNRRSAKGRRGFVDYRHEGAYVLAKGRPTPPEKPLPDAALPVHGQSAASDPEAGGGATAAD